MLIKKKRYKAYQLSYMYLLRLPIFFIIHAVGARVLMLLTGDLTVYSHLFCVLAMHFTICFFIYELVQRDRLKVLLIFSFTAISLTYPYFLPASDLTTVVSVCLLIEAAYFPLLSFVKIDTTLFVRLETKYSTGSFVLYLIILIILYFSTSIIIGQDELMSQTAAVSRLYIAYILITIILMLLCRYIDSIETILQSDICAQSTEKTIRMMIRHSRRLYAAVVVTAAFVGILTLLPEYTRLEIPEFRTSVRERNNAIVQEWRSYFQNRTAIEITDEEVKETHRIYDNGGSKGASLLNSLSIAAIIWFPSWGVIIVSIILFVRWLAKKKPKIEVVRDKIFEEDDFVFVNTLQRPPRLSGNPNVMVRRLFIKKVREHKRKNKLSVRISQTAKNISSHISETEDIGKLDNLYHKARYSGEEIRKAELSKLRSDKR